MQFIDDWNTARRLGLVVEALVGENGGKVLICSIDLQTGVQPPEAGAAPAPRPVARQLLYSLLTYMNGTRFLVPAEPKYNALGELIPEPPLPQLTIEQLHQLLK